MGLFKDQSEKVRVEFGEDWIDIKKYVTYGDRTHAQDVATAKGLSIDLPPEGNRAARREATRQVTTHASVGEFTVALLKRVIVAWSDERPVTEDAIADLPEMVIERLVERINEQDEPRTEEEKVPLGGNSQSPSPPAAVKTR